MDSRLGGGPGTDAAGRQAIFDKAHADLTKEGKIGDHDIKFVNKFAVAQLDKNGNIVSTQTFPDVTAARAAISANPLFAFINGKTTLGRSSSTVSAGATLSRRGRLNTSSGGLRPVNFTGAQNARFVILHEIKHGQGVRSEAEANRGALLQMGN